MGGNVNSLEASTISKKQGKTLKSVSRRHNQNGRKGPTA